MQNQKNGFSQVVAIVALVLVIAGGYLLFAYVQNGWPFTAFCCASPSLANWQTYTNTKYGFSFKYPSNTRLTASDEGIGLDVPITNTAADVRVRLVDQTDVIFDVTNSISRQTLTADWIAQQYADPKRIHPVATTMVGLSGFKVPHDSYVVSDQYYLQKTDGGFIMIVVNGPVANQILSTLKLTSAVANNTCQTAIYSDTNIGFSMNYFSNIWGKAQLTRVPDAIYFSKYRDRYGDDYEVWAQHAIDNPGVDLLQISLHRMESPGVWDSFTSGSGNHISESFEDHLNSAYYGANREAVTIGGVRSIRIEGENKVEYVHGSGAEYFGPSKIYIRTTIFVPKKNGDYIILIYDRPKNETMPCSFNDLLSSFKLK